MEEIWLEPVNVATALSTFISLVVSLLAVAEIVILAVVPADPVLLPRVLAKVCCKV